MAVTNEQGIVVWASTQFPDVDQQFICGMTGLPQNRESPEIIGLSGKVLVIKKIVSLKCCSKYDLLGNQRALV